MKHILETDRLVLREFSLSDAEGMYALNLDPDVIRYTGDPAFKSIADARVFLGNYSDYKRNGYGRWSVILKESGEFVGWCGLKYHEDDFVDIGFRFFKDQWGKGYATEAALATLNYGFQTLKLNEIIGRTASENTASIKVLEKLNMQFWKRGSCHGIENTLYYRINKESYHKK